MKITKPINMKIDWSDIPKETQQDIKKDLDIVRLRLKDKKEALIRLFEHYNLYKWGNYGATAVTCGNCVNNVISTFNHKIDKYGK